MSNSKFDFSTPHDAETAFYTAFADCDVQAMDAVWADGDVICIHPGTSALIGHDTVMRSWINILTHAEPPNIHIEVVDRYVGTDLAVHVVVEHIRPASGATGLKAVVVATNIYRREEDGWRILEHHASVPSSSQRQQTLQ
jgi:ketosteroid isomerase-like protein